MLRIWGLVLFPVVPQATGRHWGWRMGAKRLRVEPCYVSIKTTVFLLKTGTGLRWKEV